MVELICEGDTSLIAESHLNPRLRYGEIAL